MALMTRSTLTLLAVVAALATAPVAAHHSFAASYMEERTVTVEGELVQFLFRNPHSFVHLLVRDKDGSQVRYAVEWTGANQLGVQGVTPETLKIGDRVVITGTPGRNPSDHRIRMLSLRRPKDNLRWHKPDRE
jgi:hypothetical protein